MKNPEPATRFCSSCKTRYVPAWSKDECPHQSRTETPMLAQLRSSGQPYKTDPTAHARQEHAENGPS